MRYLPFLLIFFLICTLLYASEDKYKCELDLFQPPIGVSGPDNFETNRKFKISWFYASGNENVNNLDISSSMNLRYNSFFFNITEAFKYYKIDDNIGINNNTFNLNIMYKSNFGLIFRFDFFRDIDRLSTYQINNYWAPGIAYFTEFKDFKFLFWGILTFNSDRLVGEVEETTEIGGKIGIDYCRHFPGDTECYINGRFYYYDRKLGGGENDNYKIYSETSFNICLTDWFIFVNTLEIKYVKNPAEEFEGRTTTFSTGLEIRF